MSATCFALAVGNGFLTCSLPFASNTSAPLMLIKPVLIPKSLITLRDCSGERPVATKNSIPLFWAALIAATFSSETVILLLNNVPSRSQATNLIKIRDAPPS